MTHNSDKISCEGDKDRGIELFSLYNGDSVTNQTCTSFSIEHHSDAMINNKNKILQINFIFDTCRRVYALKDVLMMLLNTVLFILNISALVASTIETGFSTIGAGYFGINDDNNTPVEPRGDAFCRYGNVLQLQIICPYHEHLLFQLGIAIWVTYFSVLLLIRLRPTLGYTTDDFRFYIEGDRAKGRWPSLAMFIIGVLLTLGSGCAALYLDHTFGTGNTQQIGLTFVVFVFVNIQAIVTSSQAYYPYVGKVDMTGPEFANKICLECIAKSPWNLLESTAVFEAVEDAVLASKVLNSLAPFEGLGNSTLLEKVVEKIIRARK